MFETILNTKKNENEKLITGKIPQYVNLIQHPLKTFADFEQWFAEFRK